MDVGGTIPWMESVESSRKQRPRATHDHMDVGGIVTPGAVTEEAKAEGTENTEVNSISSALPLYYLRALCVLRGKKRIQSMA